MSWSMDEDKEMDEMDARDIVTEQETIETGGTPRRRIRWTVTGYGPPVGTRKETWTALLDLVALAEHRGLRVEVTEVEEEER